jgi:hypothetical protein
VTTPARRYPTAKDFRQAITQRINTESARRSRSVSELRREFLYQRFLARVFHSSNDDQWVLKGGVGLLIRLPTARFSQDIDLYNAVHGLEEAIANLRACVVIPDLDPLLFQIGKVVPMSGAVSGATITVEAYLGATLFGNFTIDLSTDLEHVGAVERIRPAHVITIDDISLPPVIALCAMADQIADKVCAMYGTYGAGQQPSTRYRDLVDLVLIVQSSSIDAAETRAALVQQARVRQIVLPAAMKSPAPSWTVAYLQQATQMSQLIRELHDLETALTFVGQCLNPLLSNIVMSGAWDPSSLSWTPGLPSRDAATGQAS